MHGRNKTDLEGWKDVGTVGLEWGRQKELFNDIPPTSGMSSSLLHPKWEAVTHQGNHWIMLSYLKKVTQKKATSSPVCLDEPPTGSWPHDPLMS